MSVESFERIVLKRGKKPRGLGNIFILLPKCYNIIDLQTMRLVTILKEQNDYIGTRNSIESI